jgi:hypothetical protein
LIGSCYRSSALRIRSVPDISDLLVARECPPQSPTINYGRAIIGDCHTHSGSAPPIILGINHRKTVVGVDCLMIVQHENSQYTDSKDNQLHRGSSFQNITPLSFLDIRIR